MYRCGCRGNVIPVLKNFRYALATVEQFFAQDRAIGTDACVTQAVIFQKVLDIEQYGLQMLSRPLICLVDDDIQRFVVGVVQKKLQIIGG